MPDIKVRYSSVDGCRKTSKFKTLKAAQKFAQKAVGEHPDLGSSYAMSFDGIGKVTVEGASLAELFPSPEQVARAAKLELIWKRCHNDFKGKIDGVRTIMTYRNGTCLVALDDLTDAEIADKLPKQ
jgi:ribosomal protein S6E (S10)